jgi:hypothetical protein
MLLPTRSVLLRSVVGCSLLVTTRTSNLASRSDTGLHKQTGEGEAFTGGGMHFPAKMESVPFFHPRSGTGIAERNWHREAILACVSRLAKAKPSLAAGCTSRQKRSPYFFAPLLVYSKNLSAS